MSDINYTALMLGKDLKYNEKITIHVPTINEITNMSDKEFNNLIKPFSITTREIFSGSPEIVDEMEERYPSLWDLASDKGGNEQIGNLLYGKNVTLRDMFISAFSYWTLSDKKDFSFLSNNKMINKKLEWIVDSTEYENFAKYIRLITLAEKNEDLIAPKNMSKNQMRVWKNIYKGRLRKLQKAEKVEMGDKILILQGSSNSFIPFEEIGKMNYYQFSNLIAVYSEKEISQQNLQIYTSYKFDTKDMKIKNWREKVSLKKTNMR
ncbi:hypothetical protein [Liquorilactobacillus hordei]|uniref:Uncharacterized protein n=1 Tax=Liquorilactobacillus hordei DSM 19519 TaxID=1423759 RepID=A0A0R1MJ36_9LACO|nr:hypothetical protein [Liquorilactobacillus hordei]KRL07926.1 hypothetical protein FC92_GL000993 [Liquorilactobacillus hordei DSM 19519]QYH51128.1 hypothetical protein G6O70_00790 [Liquorilactobacillus hordei DSM 19519]